MYTVPLFFTSYSYITLYCIGWLTLPVLSLWLYHGLSAPPYPHPNPAPHVSINSTYVSANIPPDIATCTRMHLRNFCFEISDITLNKCHPPHPISSIAQKLTEGHPKMKRTRFTYHLQLSILMPSPQAHTHTPLRPRGPTSLSNRPNNSLTFICSYLYFYRKLN